MKIMFRIFEKLKNIKSIFLAQPSLIDVGISAFLAVPVIVRRTAGWAFAICITIVMVVASVICIYGSFRCGCAITG